jgi:hypothetical protein
MRLSFSPGAKALELASEALEPVIGESLIASARVAGAGAQLRRCVAALVL